MTRCNHLSPSGRTGVLQRASRRYRIGLTGDEVTVRALLPGVYFWRVMTIQTGPDGTVQNWSEPERLTIGAPVG